MYNQGIVVYETKLNINTDYLLNLVIHDYAVVYLGHKVVSVLDRTKAKEHTLSISKEMVSEHGSRLWIMVEASGHINFDRNMLTDKKGIYSIEGLGENYVWNMWRFPIEYQSIVNWKWSTPDEDNKWGLSYPKLYEADFHLQEVGDTYFDLSEYGKGYVWVNG